MNIDHLQLSEALARARPDAEERLGKHVQYPLPAVFVPRRAFQPHVEAEAQAARGELLVELAVPLGVGHAPVVDAYVVALGQGMCTQSIDERIIGQRTAFAVYLIIRPQ